MALGNSPNAYGTISKSLHWLIAVLLILMLAGGFFMGDIADKSLKHIISNLHKLTGIVILLLMVLRLLWRLSHIRPTLDPVTPAWQKTCATLGHALLYTLVILIPLTGWIMSTAANHFPHIGTLTLPLPFIDHSKAVSHLFFVYHQTIAWVIIALIIIHIGAAISHKRFGP